MLNLFQHLSLLKVSVFFELVSASKPLEFKYLILNSFQHLSLSKIGISFDPPLRGFQHLSPYQCPYFMLNSFQYLDNPKFFGFQYQTAIYSTYF